MSAGIPPSLLQAVAVQAARRASQHALANRDRRLDANSVARNDVKLKLDEECQHIAIATVLDAFPDHSVLAEEETGEPATSAAAEYQWIIDPIDGTVNFFHGNPQWCCSVAVRRGDETLAGAVAAPETGCLYEASLGGQALCNGEPIHVSDVSEPSESLVCTGADKSESPEKRPFRFFHAIAERVQRPRVFGAAALDVCAVACGAADAYFEPGIFLWDIAAGDLILRMAGGRGSVLRSFGGHKIAYLASNGRLHGFFESLLLPLLDASPGGRQ